MDSIQIDPLVLGEKLEKALVQQSIKVSMVDSDVTSDSDIDDDEKPLSHAEESAIEECLNDTEGSLSSVDLNIFDDVNDNLHVQRTKKTRTQRSSERENMGFSGNATDYDSSSLDELEPNRKSSLTKNSLANSTSMIDVTRMSNSQAKMLQRAFEICREVVQAELLSEQNSKNKERIVRRKQRNSPPINKNDKTHIYSFFSAMADLVSTFPDEYEIRAKQNVNVILDEMLDKFKDWHLNKHTNNPQNGEFLLRILQYKKAKLQEIK